MPEDKKNNGGELSAYEMFPFINNDYFNNSWHVFEGMAPLHMASYQVPKKCLLLILHTIVICWSQGLKNRLSKIFSFHCFLAGRAKATALCSK